MKLKTFFTCMAVTALALLLTVTSASAEIIKKGTCGADGSKVNFTFDSDGTLTVYGSGEMKSYGTYNATRPWESYRDDIKKVVIEPGITRISYSAFDWASNLAEVQIADTVVYIDSYAFTNCTSLTSITIPESVKEIGESFRGCTNLAEINILGELNLIERFTFMMTAYSEDQANWEDDVFYVENMAMYCSYGKVGDVTIRPGTTLIARSAFSSQTGITSVALPDSIKTICLYAFSECSGITEIDLYPGVYIGQSAFEKCTGLTQVVIPEYATVGASAFYGCSNITKISLPDTIQGIDAYSFLSTAYVQDEANRVDGLVYIDNVLVSGAWNTGVANIREGTVAIASRAFNNSSTLKSVSIPDTVRYIGATAFARTSLSEIVIPDSVTYLGADVFDGCAKLTSVTLSKNIDSLGTYTFQNCKLLTEITIPDSVQTIGKEAFSGCVAMTKVTMGNGVKTVDTNAFSGCTKLASIYIKDLKAWAETDFANDYANPTANGSRKLYLNGKLICDLVIPDGVKRIGKYTFPYNKNLTSITIPDSVEEIGDYAFTGCSNYTTLNLGKGVKKVNHYAFYSNSKLDYVNITDLVAYAAIDFEDSFSTPVYYSNSIRLNGSVVTELNLPEGATKIGSYAFYYCLPITSVDIPRSVTSIGEKAFYNNVNLKHILYYGTHKSWQKETGGLTVIPTTATLQYVCTETRRSSTNTFTIAPAGVEIGHTVTLALYKSGRLVDSYSCKYAGEKTLTYTTTQAYDKARVFVFDSLESLEPQHTAEKVMG